MKLYHTWTVESENARIKHGSSILNFVSADNTRATYEETYSITFTKSGVETAGGYIDTFHVSGAIKTKAMPYTAEVNSTPTDGAPTSEEKKEPTQNKQ